MIRHPRGRPDGPHPVDGSPFIATIGILGGTFDPPHRGHLNLALSALDTGQISEVWLMPASIPPHKDRTHITSSGLRLAMARRLAVRDDRISVCELELERSGPSYTIDTIRALRSQHPQESFRLIIGADMAGSFGSWREAEELLRLAPPLVAQRPDFPLPDTFGETLPAGLSPEGRRILRAGVFTHEPFAASSSQIRVAIRFEDWVIADDLLTPEVADFIRDHGLYRKQPPEEK